MIALIGIALTAFVLVLILIKNKLWKIKIAYAAGIGILAAGLFYLFIMTVLAAVFANA